MHALSARRAGRRSIFAAAVAAALLSGAVPSSALENYVWWEGEKTAATNFPPQTVFSASTFSAKRRLLSGGDWLTNAGVRAGPEAYAKYRVEVAAGGQYDFWCRKFWKHGPFRWRFDGGKWSICPHDVALADGTHIRTHLGANWVFLGKVNLGEGAHDFELRLLAGEGESLAAAFDCFLLSQAPFFPRGSLRPGERSRRADTGRFAWEPLPDEFGPGALLDLRDMNERKAGQRGWVTHVGEDFRRGDGRKLRFWAVNAGGEIAGLNRNAVKYLARRLAKSGVNLVRCHGPIFSSDDPEKADEGRLEDIFHLVASLREEGIYTSLSFYFPLWASMNPKYGIEGFEGLRSRHPFALLFYVPRFQDLYRGWAKALLATPNPHTGLALGKDPAVAMVEIQNEDSLFFWTFTPENVPAGEWLRLEERFGKWALTRHGSPQGVRKAWLEAREPEDDLEKGRAKIFGAWHMTSDGLKSAGPGMRRRMGDQVAFLAGLQREFYSDTKRFFREELGARNMLIASNWVTADPALLEALEHYAYAAGDVIDRHGYFSGPHEGEGSGYSVRVGHTFENAAGVHDPGKIPVQAVQVADKPQMISELGWTNPNLYRAECVFLASAYGSLQGIDAMAFFAVGSADWEDGAGKFALSTPAVLGNFPAHALIYRRGYIEESEPVIHQALELEDLFRLKGGGSYAAQALDKLREEDGPAARIMEGEVSSFDPLAFYVGKVSRSFSGKSGRSRQMDLSNHIDRAAGTVRSRTGQLSWDYTRGIVTMDAPRAQGAAGFLSQAPCLELSDVALESDNAFSTLTVVSLDGRPIAEAGKILIQAMTTERPYGFRASGGLQGRIEEVGGWPTGVELIRARIRLKGKGWEKLRVTPLDENGYPRSQAIPIERVNNGAGVSFKLAEDSAYHVAVR